jgi:hypothetical protein
MILTEPSLQLCRYLSRQKQKQKQNENNKTQNKQTRNPTKPKFYCVISIRSQRKKKNNPFQACPTAHCVTNKGFFSGGGEQEGAKSGSIAFEFTSRRLRRNQMILANTLFQCVCYHPEEFQIITSGTDRKVGARGPPLPRASCLQIQSLVNAWKIAWGGAWG